MMRFRSLTILAAVAAAAASVPAVHADEHDGASERPRFEFTGGIYRLSVGSTFRLDDSTGTIGTELTSSGLGLPDSKTLFHGVAQMNLGQRHAIRLGTFGLSRRGQTTLSGSIDFGDETFPINTTIETDADTTVTYLSYRYTFLQRTKHVASASFGIHVTEWGTRIRDINGPQREAEDVLAPLPMFGVQYDYRFGSGWTAGGSFEFFSISTGGVDGDLTNYELHIERAFGDRWAIGLSYTAFDVAITADGDNLNAALEYDYDGPLLYARVGLGSVD